MWLAAMFLGSLFLALLWFLERTTDLSFSFWITRMLPIMIVVELFYWYAFRKAPSFISARYTMSLMTNLLGWILVVAFLHERITVNHIFGAALIIMGGLILKG